jgi:protein-disulfide isomerase
MRSPLLSALLSRQVLWISLASSLNCVSTREPEVANAGIQPENPALVGTSPAAGDTPEPTQKAPRISLCRDTEPESCAVASAQTTAPAQAAASVPSATPQIDSAPPKKLDPTQVYWVPVNPDDPALGPATARVRIVVFSDFQCPYCRHLDQTLTELHKSYGDRLQIIWKDLPLLSHRHARPAALLAREALVRRGAAVFWQVHDALYEAQPTLSEATLQALAQRFQLSWPPNETGAAVLRRSLREADDLHIAATPTSFVNGRPLIGAKRYAAFSELIEAALAKSDAATQDTGSK